MNRIGALEELVLLAVGNIGSQAYAVAIQETIEGASARAPTMGAVYTSLERLEEKGFLRSSLGEPTPKPGGRRKRYYRLTDAGVAALEASRSAREALWSGIQPGMLERTS